MLFHVGSLNYAWSETLLFPFLCFCPCRKRQHSFHAGPVWLSGLFTELQVSGQPQVQRVFGQHQHWTQPCALSQLGAPDQQQQRFNPQPVCLVMLRWPCPKNPTKTPLPPPTKSVNSSVIMQQESHDTISGFLYTWESESRKDPSLGSFPSPRLIRSTLLSHSPTATLYYLWISSAATVLRQLPSDLLQCIHLFPSIVFKSCSFFEYQYSFPWHRLCVCAPRACFTQFSCQNVTKTALAALWMQPLAKRDVMWSF